MARVIGVIGGSGLYDLDGLRDIREEVVETPFGAPSDVLIRGRLGDAEVIFLARHGRGHRLLPSEVPYRANVWALKSMGASFVISVSAVGSLREDVAPGDVVLVDQFIDRTRSRASTFFGDGCVAHIGFGDPVCARLRGWLREACDDAVAADAPMERPRRIHDGGTYLVMEGPAFSTRAESRLYRSWGADVIGMTNLPEAKLAREAGISYATLALATDYDCWHPEHDAVTVDQVIRVLLDNASFARQVLALVLPRIAAHEGPPPYADALRTALITHPDAIGADARARLAPLLDPILGPMPESGA